MMGREPAAYKLLFIVLFAVGCVAVGERVLVPKGAREWGREGGREREGGRDRSTSSLMA